MTNSKYVVAGKPKIGGAIFRGPLTATLPTSETTTLNAALLEQGYASDDGLKRSIEKAYETIRAWGGDVAKQTRTELTITIEFTLIEAANGNVAKTIWGDTAVAITPATASAGTKIVVTYKGEDVDNSAWVIDMKDGGHVRRIVMPNAQITTEKFEQTFGDSDVIAYPVTLTLYQDSSNNYFYEYSDDGIKTA
jgi:hypothetical protein